MDFSEYEPAQQVRKSSGCKNSQIQTGISRNSICGFNIEAPVLVRNDGFADHREVSQTIHETEREVWDILDCGPNNRFTCEGLLVHNCHSGNYLRFRDQWEDLYENGVSKLDDGAEKAKKEPTDKEKEAAKCPVCGHLWPGGSDTCLHCGHVRPRRNEVMDIPGEMVELDGASKKQLYTSEFREQFYKELIGYLRSTGKNDGRAYYLYKDKFGVAPAWKKEPLTPSIDVINYVRHANIAFAKRRSV